VIQRPQLALGGRRGSCARDLRLSQPPAPVGLAQNQRLRRRQRTACPSVKLDGGAFSHRSGKSKPEHDLVERRTRVVADVGDRFRKIEHRPRLASVCQAFDRFVKSHQRPRSPNYHSKESTGLSGQKAQLEASAAVWGAAEAQVAMHVAGQAAAEGQAEADAGGGVGSLLG